MDGGSENEVLVFMFKCVAKLVASEDDVMRLVVPILDLYLVARSTLAGMDLSWHENYTLRAFRSHVKTRIVPVFLGDARVADINAAAIMRGMLRLGSLHKVDIGWMMDEPLFQRE
ncbi:hypothetical protein GGF31_003385 [Allomyces arbusculus]|nr:hypothetical protein GGF31_003385 [Allomyces arbusculus]